MRLSQRPAESATPHTPTVAVAFTLDAAGEEQAVIGSERVVPMVGESAREAALRIVAGRCAEFAQRENTLAPVRVDARGVTGAVLHLLVHPDGHVDIEGEDPPQPDEFGVWPDAESEPGSTFAPVPEFTVPEQVPVGPTVLDPAAAQTTPPAQPEDPDTADVSVMVTPNSPRNRQPTAASTANRRPGFPAVSAIRRRRPGAANLGKGLRVTMAVLLLVTVVAVAGLAALSTMGDRARYGNTVTTGAQARFPEAAPDGFSAEARWVAGPLDPQGGAAVTHNNTVAFLTTDRRVVLVAAEDGSVRWSVKLPEGRPSGGLHHTRIGGADVLALRVGDRLVWWSAAEGEEAGIDVPPGVGISYHGDAPLIGLDATTVASVSAQGLQRTTVPAGAYPLAVRADGRITAASAQGWWQLRPGAVPGMPQEWERTEPQGVAAKVAGYGGSSIITVHPPDETGRPHLVVHTDRARDVLVSFRAPYVPNGQDAWIPSPSGSWGILGRTLVDIENGRVADLGLWRTVHVGDDRAVGVIDGQAVIVGPTLKAGVLSSDAFPEAVTSAGAVVRRDSQQGQMIHLLPPAQGSGEGGG